MNCAKCSEPIAGTAFQSEYGTVCELCQSELELEGTLLSDASAAWPRAIGISLIPFAITVWLAVAYFVPVLAPPGVYAKGLYPTMGFIWMLLVAGGIAGALLSREALAARKRILNELPEEPTRDRLALRLRIAAWVGLTVSGITLSFWCSGVGFIPLGKILNG